MWLYKSLRRVLLCQRCHKQIRWQTSYSFDPFKVLEIPPDANKQTIKTAYLKLAMRYHPDRNASDENARLKFEKVQNAYRVLMERIAETSSDPRDKDVPYDFTVSPLGIETHRVPSLRDSLEYKLFWIIILLFMASPFIRSVVSNFFFEEREETTKEKIVTYQRKLRLQSEASRQQEKIGSEMNEALSLFR